MSGVVDRTIKLNGKAKEAATHLRRLKLAAQGLRRMLEETGDEDSRVLAYELADALDAVAFALKEIGEHHQLITLEELER